MVASRHAITPWGSAGIATKVQVRGAVSSFPRDRVAAWGNSPPPGATEAPICNIVDEGPCYNECNAEDEARSTECAKIQDEAQRKACQDSSYEQYKSCRENCAQGSKSCTDMFDACQDKGWPCTREIEWGKTLCAICRDDCQVRRPYKYSECYTCGFQ